MSRTRTKKHQKDKLMGNATKKVVYNSDNPDEVEEVSDSADEYEKLVDKSFSQVLASDHGKVILNWLLNIAGVYDQSYVGNAATNFNEGKRYVGLVILGEMKSDENFDEYVKMMQHIKSLTSELESSE